MAFVPNPYSPAPVGPQGGYAAPPVPANVNRSGDPSQYPGYNPFNSRSAFDQPQMLGQSAYQQNQDWQRQFSDQAAFNQNESQGYGSTVQDLYNPIWQGGGGYSQDQQDQILQSQGLQGVSDMVAGNYLSGTEQQQIAGDPNSAFNLYSQEAPVMNNMSADYANAAMKQTSALGAQSTGIINQGQHAVDQAAANPGLTPTAQYLQQAGMSDQQVRDTAEMAARGVGAQYQSTQDQIRQNAAAAGNTSPLALGAAMTALDRSSAAGQADALTNARLSAQAQQRAAATGIQNTQLQAGQYQAGLGTQAGLGLMNSSLQNNQNQVAQNLGAVQWAGNQSLANQQFNANMSTGLKAQAEQNSSARANQIATNRQQTGENNQNTYLGINQLQSQRGTQVANQQQQQQAEGRQAATGQQQYYGGQANQANQFRLQGQGQANQATQADAGLYQSWGPQSSDGLKYVGAAAGLLGAAGSAATGGANAAKALGYKRGGLLDHHQLVEVGEGNRPEVILPLDPSTSPLHRNIFEHMGAKLGEAMGIHTSESQNFRKPKANPFGLPLVGTHGHRVAA